jgi:hypothetical protein
MMRHYLQGPAPAVAVALHAAGVVPSPVEGLLVRPAGLP